MKKANNSGHRQFLTLYFDTEHGNKPGSHGAAKTEVGAKRSTVTRIFATEQWKRAIIIDRDHHRTVMVLRRTSTGQISVVRGEHAK